MSGPWDWPVSALRSGMKRPRPLRPVFSFTAAVHVPQVSASKGPSGSSVSASELLNPALAPADLLFRLFHEDGVRIYDQQSLAFGCRCSRERAARILSSLPRDEVEELLEDGKVDITCQFCNDTSSFDEAEIASLLET